jgi:hypothetical protein
MNRRNRFLSFLTGFVPRQKSKSSIVQKEIGKVPPDTIGFEPLPKIDRNLRVLR